MKVITDIQIYDEIVTGGGLAAGTLSGMFSGLIDGVIIGAVFGGKYSTAGGSWTGGVSELFGIIVSPFLGGIIGLTIGFWVDEAGAKDIMKRFSEVVLGGENSNSGGQFN